MPTSGQDGAGTCSVALRRSISRGSHHRERNEAPSLSAWKGHQQKGELLEAGLVREVSVNPRGRGEQFKLLELTQAGRAVLSDFGVSVSTGHGRAGVAHQWWVQEIPAGLKARASRQRSRTIHEERGLTSVSKPMMDSSLWKSRWEPVTSTPTSRTTSMPGTPRSSRSAMSITPKQ